MKLLKYSGGNPKLSLTKVTQDQYGRVLYNRHDLYDMLFHGIDISNINEVEWHEDFEKFNSAIITNHTSKTPLKPLKKYTLDVSDFDAEQQKEWFIPEEYLALDVRKFILDRTPEHATERVHRELELYDKYQLTDILKVCVYLVDTFRNNKILWGVGRGSSVASYVLYVIGVHRIDSIKYDLDIGEFLK